MLKGSYFKGLIKSFHCGSDQGPDIFISANEDKGSANWANCFIKGMGKLPINWTFEMISNSPLLKLKDPLFSIFENNPDKTNWSNFILLCSNSNKPSNLLKLKVPVGKGIGISDKPRDKKPSNSSLLNSLS